MRFSDYGDDNLLGGFSEGSFENSRPGQVAS